MADGIEDAALGTVVCSKVQLLQAELSAQHAKNDRPALITALRAVWSRRIEINSLDQGEVAMCKLSRTERRSEVMEADGIWSSKKRRAGNKLEQITMWNVTTTVRCFQRMHSNNLLW